MAASSLSLWQAPLGNRSYWGTKSKQPNLSLGPGPGGAGAAAVLSSVQASEGVPGAGASGQNWALRGSLVSSLLGADWSQRKGQMETFSIGFSATQLGVESNQNKSFL